jgi:hypothetical protein
MATIEGRGGLDSDFISKKMICIGVDAASTLQCCQCCYDGVTTQMVENFAPHVFHLHCFGHKTNLALKALSYLDIIIATKKVLATTHAYFHY